MKKDLKKALLVGGASAVLAMGSPAVAQEKKTDKKSYKIENVDAAARRTVGMIRKVEIVDADTAGVQNVLYHVNDFDTGETHICTRVVHPGEAIMNFSAFTKVEVIEIYNPKLHSWQIYQINNIGTVKPDRAPMWPNQGNQR